MNNKLIQVLDETIGNQLLKCIAEVDENEDLFTIGLDSVGFINIIIALENEYDIFIDQDDLALEQFSTIHNINEYVQKKLSE